MTTKPTYTNKRLLCDVALGACAAVVCIGHGVPVIPSLIIGFSVWGVECNCWCVQQLWKDRYGNDQD